MDYEKMTKAELIKLLQALQGPQGSEPSGSRSRSTADESPRLRQELQIHQIELEMQNRELQEAQQQLEASRDRYADLYDFAPVGYVSLDGKGVIEEVNLTGATLFGIERARLLGQPLIRYLVPADRQILLTRLTQCSHAGETLSLEVSLRVKSGRSIPVQLLCLAIHRPESPGSSYRVVITDISERKQLEFERSQLFAQEQAARAKAEAANRLKDEFLALVSHELRSPLNAINGWTKILRAGRLTPDETAQALAIIERNAWVQTQLIEDLLDVSSIIMGKLKMERQAVDVEVMIGAALDTMRPAAEAKQIRLERLSEPLDLVLKADPNRLQQAIWNLISNAVKFTPAGGQVGVEVARAGEQVRISVSDTGIGIAPDFLPYVFERFRQAELAIGRKYGGLGLGLAIVRHIVELHGGEVEAVSEGMGRGATFTIKLPLTVPAGIGERPTAMASRTMEVPAVIAARLPGLRILVVDDEESDRNLLKVMLGEYGVRVTVAASASEALALLETTPFDLLVSDLGMPGEDGYALIRQAREREAKRGGRLPAVALTAYARSDDRVGAISAGFDSHVPKPVEFAELAAVIASLVERSGRNETSRVEDRNEDLADRR
ncbi:MAG TPA: hybrid sensor histidine kinase/response regulator [Blastocatellia bacterium]|nr:hybrid sensor histidine kinase/response regulator [Blastocatellia bacterium]